MKKSVPTSRQHASTFLTLPLPAAMFAILLTGCGQKDRVAERTTSPSAAPSPTSTPSPWPTATPRPPSPTPTDVPTPVLPDWVRSAPFGACSSALPAYVGISPDFKPQSCYVSTRDPNAPQEVLTFEFQRQGYAVVSHGPWEELLSPQVFPPTIIPELLPTKTTAPAILRFANRAVCLVGATGNDAYRIDLRSGAEAPNGAEQFVSCYEERFVPQTPAPIPPVTEFMRVDDSWCAGMWGKDDPAPMLIAPWTSGAQSYDIIDCRQVSTGGRGTLWLFRLNGRLGIALIGFTRSARLTDATGSTSGFDGSPAPSLAGMIQVAVYSQSTWWTARSRRTLLNARLFLSQPNSQTTDSSVRKA